MCEAAAFVAWARRRATLRGLPFVPTPAQDVCLALGFWALARGVWVLLKARQIGGTTLWMLWVIWKLETCPGFQIAVVAPSKRVAVEVLSRWREVVSEQSSHPDAEALRQVRLDSADQFQLWNGARVAWFTVGGEIATAEAAGRSGSYRAAILTEWAFCDSHVLALATLRALAPALERGGASWLVDSTPGETEDAGRSYYDLAQAALKGAEGGCAFIPWWLEPTYRDPVPLGFGATLSLSERRLAAWHGLDWGQLAWRRRIIASPAFVGDVGAFLVAYLEDPSTAFPPVASGGALPDRLRRALTERQRAKGWPEPTGGNELDPALRGAAWAGGSPCDEPWVRVWVPPSPRRRWLLVADPSEGLARSDWQAAAVIDPLTGEIAAMAREEIDPARFGTVLARLAGLYGATRDAWVDATGGYAARVVDAAGRSGLALRELRWSGGQRGWAWGEAVADLARDPAVVVCPDLARELLRLRRGRSGRIAAAAGSTDDLVACLALAQVARAEAARGGPASQRDPRFGRLRRRSPLIGW